MQIRSRRPQVRLQVLRGADDAPGKADHLPSLRCQDSSSAQRLEQLGTHSALEFVHRLGEGGLTDAQSIRRICPVGSGRNLDQICELPKLNAEFQCFGSHSQII